MGKTKYEVINTFRNYQAVGRIKADGSIDYVIRKDRRNICEQGTTGAPVVITYPDEPQLNKAFALIIEKESRV